MEEVLNQIFALLGGVTVIVAALFAFIGKLWLSRIIEKDKHQLQKQILSINDELSTTSKKLEAELQRSIHIGKVQFEHEFSIYKEVWVTLIELRMATMRLRPALDHINPDQSEEERTKERLNAFYAPFQEFRNVIEKNKPFYSSKVYESLEAVLEVCYGESVDFEYKERKKSEYYKEARENHKKIIESIDRTCEAIRNRNNEVSVR